MNKSHVFFIADDDPDDQELFINALLQIDKYCTCVTAFDGVNALQRLNEIDPVLPDIIFLDLNMPKMTGRQCLGRIKQLESLQQVPVIIYSTTADKKEIEELTQMGAAFFLQKPNRFNDLHQALEKIVSHNWSAIH